jgi:hypothetical protein
VDGVDPDGTRERKEHQIVFHFSACTGCGAHGRVGPTLVREAGRRDVGEKNITFFGRNALQNAIFWYFIVLPPYPLPKTYDGWVRCEG